MISTTRRLFAPSTWRDTQYIGGVLRGETAGGFLMLAAAAAALLWANIDAGSYRSLSTTTLGPSSLGLDLDVATWASDGLLAVFFFVAGLELKREVVTGSLRRPAAAVLPIVAAMCGMAAPIAMYTLTNQLGAGGEMTGWAVPTATDIAFALAVLAVIGSQLPSALRAFLLTLAVVDDVLAILIIAIFFTDDLTVPPLAGAAVLVAAYHQLQRRRIGGWWLYVPMALVSWVLVHESGVHATVVGVAFGLLTSARPAAGETRSPAERVEHQVRPFSAAFCVPIFALFAAGIEVSGQRLTDVFSEPVTLGVVLGLVVGKPLGIAGGTALTARFTRAELSDDLDWSDVIGLGVLAGVGFTVSLLIGELAFDGDAAATEGVKTAVLVGSLLAAGGAALLLGRRNGVYRRIAAAEAVDTDADGIPDVYELDRDDV